MESMLNREAIGWVMTWGRSMLDSFLLLRLLLSKLVVGGVDDGVLSGSLTG